MAFLNLSPSINRYQRFAAKVPFGKLLKLKSFMQGVQETYYIARDPDTPFILSAVGLIGVLYVVCPFDFDFVPIIGWLDDMGVFGLCNNIVRSRAPSEVVSKADKQSLLDPAVVAVSKGKSHINDTKDSVRMTANHLRSIGEILCRWWRIVEGPANFVYGHQKMLALISYFIFGYLLIEAFFPEFDWISFFTSMI